MTSVNAHDHHHSLRRRALFYLCSTYVKGTHVIYCLVTNSPSLTPNFPTSSLELSGKLPEKANLKRCNNSWNTRTEPKFLNPSVCEEALWGFICLLRNWATVQQLHHVWNIMALVFSCWMRCLMILRGSDYCCWHSTAVRRIRCVTKFTTLITSARIRGICIQSPVFSRFFIMENENW